MKHFIFLSLLSVLVIGCSSSMSCEQFFSKLSVEDIEKIDEDSLTFRTSYIDYMFKSQGTILEPNIAFNIKYDTLSRYMVIVGGNDISHREQKGNKTNIKSDSIELSYVIVKKKDVQAKRYSCKSNLQSDFYKKWKNCPVPLSIMKKIRKDFFIRMKYQKYEAICDDSLTGITVMHQYQLF